MNNTLNPSASSVSLQGSNCPSLNRSSFVGATDPNTQMQVSVLLSHPQNAPVSTDPFKSIAPEDFAQYHATQGQIDKLRAFAAQNGLKVSSEDPTTHTVKLSGDAAQFGQAFGVKLGQYKSADGNEFRGYDGQVKLPTALGSDVGGVFGLENRPFAHTNTVMNHAARAGSGYTGPQIAQLYNFPKGTDGQGQTIGIIELGGGYDKADLQKYFDKIGVPMPGIKAVSVDGAKNAPENNPDGADGEVDLDLEVAGGVAPKANIVVYFAPNTEQGFIDAVNQAAHDKQNKPGSLSISWGAPESGWSQQGMTNLSNALRDAAAQGINVFAASGDNGSTDGQSDNANHADFPASSPWAIGTGGTRLTSRGGQPVSETAWNDGANGGASGGGVSGVFPEPDWQQQGAQVPSAGRGVPDVAGNADPATGYDVFVDGTETTIGGTSAVAPLYAGLTARLGQAAGGRLGYLNPVFYAHPEDFNDITEGGNGGFEAGAGWDPVTGLGSPNGTKILNTLLALQSGQTSAA